MAGVSCFIPFSCKTLSPSLYQTQGHLGFGKKNSLSSGKGREVAGLKFPIGGGQNRGARPVLRIRATGAVADDDEWGPGNEEWTGEAVATGLGEEEKEEKEEKKPIEASKEEKEEEKEEKKPIEASKEEKEEEKKPIEASKEEKKEEKKPIEPSKVDKLKKALVDSLYGTDRGLNVSSEKRAEIVELITQLEALNPTPAPTEALTLLNGKWILAYTSFSGLFPLLASGALPLVKVEEISQTIDAQNLTVQNAVQFSGPLATTSLVTNAKFDIRSPKRVQLKFDEGIIGTPQLTDSIETPENVDVLGQKIDLSPLKGLLTSLEDTASSVAKTISSQPPLKIPISGSNAQSWLLTTYLDEELRISRGDGGSVFVLIKEGSSLLTS